MFLVYFFFFNLFFFFFKQKTAYEIMPSLVGSEMCIRDSYDLLYNPNVTLFMKKGEAQGAVVKNGLEMLLLQAFAAWEIWHK